MNDWKRSATATWIWTNWLAGILLAGGIVIAGCNSMDSDGQQTDVPEPTFSVTFAGGEFITAFQIPDGGYVAAGTRSDFQGFIYMVDPNGTEIAHHIFDQNASTESVSGALPVTGGGYVVCGHTDVQGWVAKIDGSLQTVENNLYLGGVKEDSFRAMVARSDGGFVLGGERDWDRDNVTEVMGTGNGWLVKVTSNGVYESQISFGGPARDYVLTLEPADGQGFFFGGATYPTSDAQQMAWVCKTNAAADALVWNRSYTYENGAVITGLVATPDGGCICVGGTLRMETATSGKSDAYILKINASGDKMWEYGSGIDGIDYYASIAPAHDGGYLCAGNLHGAAGAWLVKIDDNGNTVWERTFAGDFLNSVKQTTGNGYVCGGGKNNQAWILKVDINGDFEL